MSTHDALLRVRAFAEGRAQDRRALRHFHVSKRPLVIAYVQMAGEPYSLWGAIVGKSADDTKLIVAGDPRNRDEQYQAFDQFADYFTKAVERHKVRELEPLQLWVSNPGAAANLRRLSRVMRARAQNANPQMQLTGDHLEFYSQAGSAPGSALCIAATSALSRQRVTGQSAFEDANLASQLVWWDRSLLAEIANAGADWQSRSVFDLAAEAEQWPMGTLTLPKTDEEVLQGLLRTLTEARGNDQSVVDSVTAAIRAALFDHLLPIWNAIWAAHQRLLTMTEAPWTAERWRQDADAFDTHWRWVEQGNHRAFSDKPIRAAQILSKWEALQTESERQEVIEDDLAFLETVLNGQALIGEVVSVDSNRKVGHRKRPRISLRTPPTDITESTELWWRQRPKLKATVVAIQRECDGATVTLEFSQGHTDPQMPYDVGAVEGFIALAPAFWGRKDTPRDLPWTHTAPVSESDFIREDGDDD